MAEETTVTEQTVTPGEYFNALKGKKQKINDGILEEIYNNCLILLEKYQRTNQVDAMKKLLFHLDVIEKERRVLAAGLDTFVYLSDVKAYVENVQDRVVKIIELERYEREIPEDGRAERASFPRSLLRVVRQGSFLPARLGTRSARLLLVRSLSYKIE